nr:hypothetical protein [Tanacetum cinerariifolium]
MVAILEKSEHNVDFHPIVDFVEASPLRRNIKLKDKAEISSLPDAKLFENLTLMGYNISPSQKFTFQKGQFSHQWKYLIHTIMQCLSPKSTGFNEFSSNIATALGEGSGTPTEPHHIPSSKAQQTSPTTHSSPTLLPITTAPIPTVTLSDTPHLRQYTRRGRIAQSLAPPPIVNEPASPLRDVSQGEACPTVSSFEAEHDRANIAKTSTLPHESTSRVPSLAADEGKRFGDDAPIKRRMLDEGEEVAEKGSNDTEEMINVLTSMDAATILSSGVAEVPTGSGSIPTVGPPATGVLTSSDVVPTATLIFATATVVTPYTRRKGKEKMIESETLKKKKIQEQMDIQIARELEEEMEREAQRMNEQIARDAEIVRIHAEEELQIMIDGLDRSNETVAKYLQEYHQFATELPIERRIELISDLVRYQDNYAKVHKYHTQQRKPLTKEQQREFYTSVLRNQAGWKAKDFKGMTLEEIKENFDPVWKQIHDFIPIGSKEEAKRFKRKGIRFEQESVKKLKTSKEVKATEEVLEEKLKEMMQLVPVEEVYVEALQVKHPIIDWKSNTLLLTGRFTQRDKEVIGRLQGWEAAQPVTNSLLIYAEDQLWTHTQNIMHALVEWKLYDSCGVHHVTFKDKEIFMLVEKDYPLRKGLAIVMISYKLQVENYSQMASDLILKIYKIANRPRQEDD